MLFLRRVFYDLDTGVIVHAYMMQGDIWPCTADEDAERMGLINFGVLEWDTETMDPAIEDNFADPYNNHITVDVTAHPPMLVFNHVDVPAPPPPEDEAADMQAALALLGVEPVVPDTEDKG